MFFSKKQTITDPTDEKVFVKHVLIYSTKTVDGKAEYNGSASVNLYETKTSKRRSFKIFGRLTDSPSAIFWYAAVEAWEHGGPLPKGMDWIGYTPPPKPRKDLPTNKAKKQEIVKSSNVIQLAAKDKAA